MFVWLTLAVASLMLFSWPMPAQACTGLNFHSEKPLSVLDAITIVVAGSAAVNALDDLFDVPLPASARGLEIVENAGLISRDVASRTKTP